MQMKWIGGIVVLALIGAAALYFATRSAPAAEDGGAVRVITAKEGKELLDAGGYTLVDVRTEAEYAEGHIPGALLIPNESIESEPPAALPDKTAPLLVYCRSGRRSAAAAKKLAAMGYETVYDMGGIQSWPYGTTKGE